MLYKGWINKNTLNIYGIMEVREKSIQSDCSFKKMVTCDGSFYTTQLLLGKFLSLTSMVLEIFKMVGFIGPPCVLKDLFQAGIEGLGTNWRTVSA